MTFIPLWSHRVYNCPLLLAPEKLLAIRAYTDGRMMGLDTSPPPAMPAPTETSARAPAAPPGIAIVPVVGTLVQRGGTMDAMSGLQTYGSIVAAVADAVADPAIAAVLLDVDSSGGEVAGAFDAARAIQAMRGTKPLWAIANSRALSAAYAIAAAADRIVVTDTGHVGSIGVIATHVDQSLADAAEGLVFSEVTAGARKADFSPHQPLSLESRSWLQADVEHVYAIFVAFVAAARGIAAKAVAATEAGIFRGADAIGLGLADAIGSMDWALAAMAATVQPGRQASNPRSSSQRHGVKAMTDMQEVSGNDTPQPPAEVIDLSAARAAGAAEAISAALEVTDLCALAGQPQRAAEFIRDGKTPSQVRQILLAARAAQAEAQVILTAHGGGVTRSESTIVTACRRLADAELARARR